MVSTLLLLSLYVRLGELGLWMETVGLKAPKPPLLLPLWVRCYIDSGGRARLSGPGLPARGLPSNISWFQFSQTLEATLRAQYIPGTDLPSAEKMEKQRSKMQSRLERTRNLMVGGWMSRPGEAAVPQKSSLEDTQTFTEWLGEVFPDGQGSNNLGILT